MNEEQIKEIIRDELRNFMQSDRYNFARKLQIQDSVNIQLGRGTGSQIGEAADQKIALHGATPTIQSSKINDPTAAGAGYVQATAQSSVDKIKEILDALEAKGITSAT